MAKESITFKELDAIIDKYNQKDDKSQKRALLIVKSTLDPYRKKDSIPREIVEKVVNYRQTTEEAFADMLMDEDDDVSLHLMDTAEKLGNAVRIIFEEDEE